MNNLALRFFTDQSVVDKLNKSAVWIPFNPQTGQHGKFYTEENNERALLLKSGNSVYEYSNQDYNFNTHNFTLCFWLKFVDAFQNSDNSIIDNHVIINLENDIIDYVFTPDTEWHHYAFVRIKKVLRFYIDGKLIKTLDSSENFDLTGSSYVYVGSNLDNLFGNELIADDIYLFANALWNTSEFDVPELYMPTELYYRLYTTNIQNYGMSDDLKEFVG